MVPDYPGSDTSVCVGVSVGVGVASARSGGVGGVGEGKAGGCDRPTHPGGGGQSPMFIGSYAYPHFVVDIMSAVCIIGGSHQWW